jgi:ABC transporter ATM
MNAADNQAAATATDSLLNYEAVKYFNNEAYEMEKYDKSLAKYEKAAMRTASSLAFLNAGQNAIFSIALASMMWMASGQIIHGALTVGDLVFINGLVFQLSTPLNFLGSVYRETRQSLMDMDAMFKLQSVESRIRDAPDATDLDPSKGYEIKFENVSFGYTESRPILKDVSFTIPTGHSVAFVGPSGCGKSTIIRLLFRFYDPEGGRITINGHDIRQISLKSLRQALGVLPQDTILFNQTIYQNISYGNPGAPEERVYQASEMANLHNRISTVFPEGYETMVGERGMMISGGEKQRVQLARVFLKV